MIALGVIEVLAALFLIWLFGGDMRSFVIIGILFGGLAFVSPVVVAYYGVVYVTNKMICPVARVGTIIFATDYVLSAGISFMRIFSSSFETATLVILMLLKVVFLITTLGAIAAIYHDSKLSDDRGQ